MATSAKRRKLSEKRITPDAEAGIPDNEMAVDYHKIVKHGNLKALCNILQSRPSRTGINLMDDDGRKPVILAAELGHSRIVKELLKVKCHYINEQVEDEEWELHTPMHAAIAYGRVEVVKALLKHGVSPDRCTFYSKFTPLMAACLKGNEEIVRLLLEYGAKTEVKSTLNVLQGEYFTNRHIYSYSCRERLIRPATALVYAVVANHYGCAKLLIEAGTKNPGSVHIESAWAGNVNLVHYPLRTGNIPLVKLLVDSFGEQGSPHGNGISWLNLVVQMHGAVKSKSIFETTTNGTEIMSHNTTKKLKIGLQKSFDYLVSVGCDVNGLPSDEHTARSPLYHAVKNKDNVMLNGLLNNNVTMKQRTEEEDVELKQTLINTKERAIVKALLDQGIELLPDDHDGFEKQGLVYVQHSCPFILAIKNDDVRIVKLLISCDKNNVVSRMVTEKSLFTPLMYFVLDHNFSMDANKKKICMIDILLKAGVSVNATDSVGGTALHYACSKHSSHCAVTQLLEAGALVNVMSAEGIYPVTEAIRCTGSYNGHHQSSNLVELIKNGADVNVRHRERYGRSDVSTFHVLFCDELNKWKTRPEEFICMVKCLKLAGYKFSNDDLQLLKAALPADPSDKTMELYTTALNYATEFADLMTMCRASIVNSIQTSYKNSVTSLPLPAAAKYYLLFEDLPKC